MGKPIYKDNPFIHFIHLGVHIRQLETSRHLELRKDAGGRPAEPVMSQAHIECLVHAIPLCAKAHGMEIPKKALDIIVMF